MSLKFLLLTFFAIGCNQVLANERYRESYPGMYYYFEEIESTCEEYNRTNKMGEFLKQTTNHTARNITKLEEKAAELTEMKWDLYKNYRNLIEDFEEQISRIEELENQFSWANAVIEYALKVIEENPPKNISGLRESISNLESHLNLIQFNMTDVMNKTSELESFRESTPQHISYLYGKMDLLVVFGRRALWTACQLMAEVSELEKLETNSTKDMDELSTSVLRLQEIVRDMEVHIAELSNIQWQLGAKHRQSLEHLNELMSKVTKYYPLKNFSDRTITEFKKQLTDLQQV